jgi:RNA polymerase sigma-70 factor (ECF subfamily)
MSHTEISACLNGIESSGVFTNRRRDVAMHEYTEQLTTPFLSMEDDLKQEFEMRIAECSNLTFRVAYGVLRNREDAEDVTQEAFAKAYRSFSALRDRERFRAWIVRIAWRMALDHQRSRKRRTVREEIHVEIAGSVGFAASSAERANQVWRAIDALPEKMRIVIILANIEEHGTHDIAAMLDIPEGTVKSRLFHARRLLKELLQ